MADQTDEKITVTPFYILRQSANKNGRTDFINMTTNTPENTYLHVQMLGYEACTPDKKDRIHTFEGYTLHFILNGKGRFDVARVGFCLTAGQKDSDRQKHGKASLFHRFTLSKAEY